MGFEVGHLTIQHSKSEDRVFDITERILIGSSKESSFS